MNQVEKLKIKKLIYQVRGRQVMLYRDLAKLYQCKDGTKTVNLAVKRNIEIFPNYFYFKLTKIQSETSNISNYGGVRKLPYMFTE